MFCLRSALLCFACSFSVTFDATSWSVLLELEVFSFVFTVDVASCYMVRAVQSLGFSCRRAAGCNVMSHHVGCRTRDWLRGVGGVQIAETGTWLSGLGSIYFDRACVIFEAVRLHGPVIWRLCGCRTTLFPRVLCCVTHGAA